MIEAHAPHPVRGCGWCGFDVAASFADDGDDAAVVVVVVAVEHDDCANGCHAVMCVAFLQFSLHVQPTNYHLGMNSMATKSDYMQPMMCTCRPLIAIVAHMVANNFQNVHCSMWDLVCCC